MTLTRAATGLALAARAAFWLVVSLGYRALSRCRPESDSLRYGGGAAEGIARVLWLRARI